MLGGLEAAALDQQEFRHLARERRLDFGPFEVKAGRFEFGGGEVPIKARLLVLILGYQILLESPLLPGVFRFGSCEPELGLLEGQPALAGVHPREDLPGGDRIAFADVDLRQDA